MIAAASAGMKMPPTLTKGLNGNPLTGDDELTDPASIAPAKPTAWWSKAYSTLEAADHPEKSVVPPPARKITPTQ
jgi:hypothetical protein